VYEHDNQNGRPPAEVDVEQVRQLAMIDCTLDEMEAVLRLGKPSGAAFSNPSTSEHARDFANTSPNRLANVPASSPETRHSSLVTTCFSAQGPVLQAQGLPQGDLIKALLTNWSIVPHACLFRRSILEKAGGFPEDIWVGEDQLLFLRCLLAGAKVVHTPETMIFYRVGDDPGKLTASGAAQKRHARDWARFLLRANQEVTSDEWRVVGKTRCVTTENTEGTQGDAQGTCSCSSKSDYLPRELADSPVSESLTRSASGPASSPATSQSLLATASQAPLPATSYSLPVTTPPAEWYGFRLRAYEAWRDLEKFFPGEENELKENLERIFLQKRKFRKTEILKYQAAGFLLRKLGGLRFQVLGYRENTSFRCGKFSVLGGERCVAVNQKN
jgi:hypothetical protein